MTAKEQEQYASEVESNATKCAEELSAQVLNAPVANAAGATRQAIKLAYIRGTQWAMRDALQTVKSKTL